MKYDKAFVAKQGNMRNNDWSLYEKNDPKHITYNATPKFAANLKRAFRAALGIKNEELRFNNDKYKPFENIKEANRRFTVNDDQFGERKSFGNDKEAGRRKYNDEGYKEEILKKITQILQNV